MCCLPLLSLGFGNFGPRWPSSVWWGGWAHLNSRLLHCFSSPGVPNQFTFLLLPLSGLFGFHFMLFLGFIFVLSGQGHREMSILSCVVRSHIFWLLIFMWPYVLCIPLLKILAGILFYFLIFNSISQFVYFKWQSFLFAFIVVIDILGLDSNILYMDFDF